MRFAEKHCRKIKSGRTPFSPEASLWIRRSQVYRSLLRYHVGKICNRGNLKQLACRCDILDAFSLSIEEIYFRLKACVKKCDYYKKMGNIIGGSTSTTNWTPPRRKPMKRLPSKL
jgi:hypothetical protein